MDAVTEQDTQGGGLPVARPDQLSEEYHDMVMTSLQFLKRRTALISAVRDHLVEATYKSSGYIDRENDYYKVPGSNSYAFTRQGAGKLSDLYRVKQMEEQTDKHVYEKDHVMYRVRVYVGRGGLVQGVAAGSCSTSEKRFTSMGVKKLYGATYKNNNTQNKPDWEEVQPPDYRAADHDVLTMAKKRGIVNAIVDALAAHDVLTAAAQGPTTDQLNRALTLLTHESVTDEERVKFTTWITKPSRTAEKVEEQLAALEDRVHTVAEGTV